MDLIQSNGKGAMNTLVSKTILVTFLRKTTINLALAKLPVIALSITQQIEAQAGG